MASVKHELRSRPPKRYSRNLLNSLFRRSCARIEFLELDPDVTRQTVAKYLGEIVETGLLEKHRAGRNDCYIDIALFAGVSGASRSFVPPRSEVDIGATVDPDGRPQK